MSSPRHDDVRRALLREVQGEVLEIGFGTGLNLPHYPEHISRITTVDVNPGMNVRARRRIEKSPIEVDHQVLNGEALPMDDATFDSVVSTWTLCSIENAAKALSEFRRVLKPDGRFFFAEHGLAPDAKVRRWQHRLNPLQRKVGDGCNLDRNIREIVGAAGFTITQIDEFYWEKAPKFLGYTYLGTAAK
jgi:ubiquinone/menaquinone biosynthesis C-methylase UbiE